MLIMLEGRQAGRDRVNDMYRCIPVRLMAHRIIANRIIIRYIYSSDRRATPHVVVFGRTDEMMTTTRRTHQVALSKNTNKNSGENDAYTEARVFGAQIVYRACVYNIEIVFSVCIRYVMRFLVGNIKTPNLTDGSDLLVAVVAVGWRRTRCAIGFGYFGTQTQAHALDGLHAYTHIGLQQKGLFYIFNALNVRERCWYRRVCALDVHSVCVYSA